MDRLRMHWAVVFQQNALYSATVYENIALQLREVKDMDEEEGYRDQGYITGIKSIIDILNKVE